MIVTTDNIHYAEQVLPQATGNWSETDSLPGTEIPQLSERLFASRATHRLKLVTDQRWKYLFVVESTPGSQYDLLIELNRGKHTLPDGILCIAGSGKFHGFRDRSWSSSPGNIHLSVHLAPAKPIDHFGVGFTILAAVSVVDAIDSLPGLEGRAGVKWVNDILIDNAKVCGVLAFTQTVQETVTAAVVGIGLNVETTPSVEPTAFVPKAASLADFAPDPESCRQHVVFDKLIRALDRNYRLLADGNYHALLERYRERCAVMGREVVLCSDESGDDDLEVIGRGRVTGIGENLELLLEGYEQPFSKGRLILRV